MWCRILLENPYIQSDFYSLIKLSPAFNKQKIDNIIDETIDAVSQWNDLAKEWEVPTTLADEISKNLRLDI